MAYNIVLIPGDGIGPEVSEATRRVLEATGVEIEWEIAHAGADVLEKCGTPLPDSVLESIKRTKVAIKGPVTTPIGSGFRSVNVALRKSLDLYTCLRPCKASVRKSVLVWETSQEFTACNVQSAKFQSLCSMKRGDKNWTFIIERGEVVLQRCLGRERGPL